jgi:hypothetical protein
MQVRKNTGLTTLVYELLVFDDTNNDLTLYRSCNAKGHVIQASSAPYYKNQGTRQKLTEAFASSGFESVAFQEYHEDYPHVKYTVGFAGRPGGPDFYVSVLDNTRNHGPGGQGNYADPQEADPCFGKVVEGFDAVDRMHKMPKEPGDYEAMVRNVGIEYARILDRRAK